MTEFSRADSDTLKSIMMHRRDVRGNRFLNTAVPQQALDEILLAASHAPSVGFSQPWEFVLIRKPEIKQAIKENFVSAKAREEGSFSGVKLSEHQQLKLEGIHEAPINIAVFYTPSAEPVLGQSQMTEAGPYSVVCAIQNMWLMARSLNIGLGWVSILDPDSVKQTLKAPADHQLIAYLCLGYVDFFYDSPELERKQWEKRKALSSLIIEDSY
jgi:5,6-dimethylbenzimidazole synthase